MLKVTVGALRNTEHYLLGFLLVTISQPARVIKGTFDLYVSFIPKSNQRAFQFEFFGILDEVIPTGPGSGTASADLPN